MIYCSSVVGVVTMVWAARGGGGVQMHIVTRDLFYETSTPAVGFPQPLIQRVPRALDLEVDRMGREAVGVKNDPLCGSWRV